MLREEYLSEYIIQDPNEKADAYLLEIPFFEFCLQQPSQLNDQIITQLFTYLKQIGDVDSYENELLSSFSEAQINHYQQHKVEVYNAEQSVSYEVLIALGYSPEKEEIDHISPVTYLKELKQTHQLEVRGLFYDSNGKLRLEPNTFAKYLLKRMALVQTQTGVYYHYTRGKYEKIEKNVLKKLCRDVLNEAGPTLWTRHFEANYMAAFAHEVPFVTEFDKNPDVINLENGLLNIKTLELKEHSPNYYALNQLPYAYDSEASCQRFESFINDIFEGDTERIDLIQQLLGYCWLQEVHLHKAFIFLGAGSNGKSVLAKVMQQLYGSFNTSATSLSDFQGRFGLQDLAGKLVNISGENEVSGHFSTENLKAVTSGDAISVERKYEDAFTSTLHVKLVLLMNNMMNVSDTSDGLMRRLQIIPFNKQYVELRKGQTPIEGVSYMNPYLVDELLEELPGILNFSLEGLQILMQNDFKLPASTVCDEALDQYKKHQNPVIEFVEERIEYSPDARLLRSSITKEFRHWLHTQDNGSYRHLTSHLLLSTFKGEIAKQGYPIEEVKINGYMYLKHIQFK